MNGIDYLLDTNLILGLLKSDPDTLALIGDRPIEAGRCAYSAITRMELLGFPGVTPLERSLSLGKLGKTGRGRLGRSTRRAVPDRRFLSCGSCFSWLAIRPISPCRRPCSTK